MVEQSNRRFLRVTIARAALEGTVFLGLVLLTIQSAVLAKRVNGAPALVAFDDAGPVSLVLGAPERGVTARSEMVGAVSQAGEASGPPAAQIHTPPEGFERYFDGRPIRPVRTIWMTVTAYSPDHRSCGHWADGYTATNHSVWTNAMRLVAADTSILPFGSLVSVPGYAEGEVVPVLDRGGAIKGRRLDVLYPTHEIARQWGVKRIPVTVWEYADGKPRSLGHRKRG